MHSTARLTKRKSGDYIFCFSLPSLTTSAELREDRSVQLNTNASTHFELTGCLTCQSSSGESYEARRVCWWVQRQRQRYYPIDSLIKLAADDDDIRSFNVLITCTGNKARSTLATMSKQHCRSNRQLCCLLLRQCCRFAQQCRSNVDFVERTKFQRKTRSTLLSFLATKSNVASTLLLVWTGLKTSPPRRGATCDESVDGRMCYYGHDDQRSLANRTGLLYCPYITPSVSQNA